MHNIHVGCSITVMTMKRILFGILIISIFSKYEYFFFSFYRIKCYIFNPLKTRTHKRVLWQTRKTQMKCHKQLTVTVLFTHFSARCKILF